MSIFALHDELPVTITKPVGTISLSGDYSILNDGSNVNITNSKIDQLIPSFVINNGMTNIVTTKVELPNNIVVDNSSNYIDDQNYFDTKYTFVEKGSLFNYQNVSYTLFTTLLDISSNNFQLIIQATDPWKNSKKKFVQERGLENIGTGNQLYSTHFLNNGSYGYWGNKFGGQVTSSFVIDIHDYQDLNTFFNTMPRNLNGYTVTINYKSSNFSDIQLSSFYNGIMNINFYRELMDDIEKNIQMYNNNLTVNITYLNDTYKLNYQLYDNPDINVRYKTATSAITAIGDNNYVNFYFHDTIRGKCEIFKTECYGNKVLISSATDDNKEYFTRQFEQNDDNTGNFITITPSDDKIGDMINDGCEVGSLQNQNFMPFTIDEVHPKKVRDVSDIGTIIGWPAKLPVPRGYYVCSGQQVKVDLNNPKDQFYNGQLAWYMNNNLSLSTITLPDVPAASPSCLTFDPNYYFEVGGRGANFVPVNKNEKLIYIIKYNNNFENKKKGL